MIELVGATIVASLLGSIHCVGMCGPFVILASSQARDVEQSLSRWEKLLPLWAYHFGRLTTYVTMGFIAGLFGLAANTLASPFGYTNIAAVSVGVTMIVLGVFRLMQWQLVSNETVTHSKWMMNWSRTLVYLRKRLRTDSQWMSGYLWGAISTLLPCGWLYMFVLAAAATGSPISSPLLMVAFWTGTLPLLSLVSIGTRTIGARLQTWVQPAAAMLLIAMGSYAIAGRSHVDLSHAPSRHAAQEPLPCCEVCGDKGE